MKIGIMFGNQKPPTGGNALFYASVRMDIRRVGQIAGEDVIGNRTRSKVVKKQRLPPF